VRLALIANVTPAGFLGGTELVVESQARELARLGNEVKVLAAGHSAIAATEDFDLAHVHQWSTLGWDRVRRLAGRAPVVLTLHDHFASCARAFRVPPPGLRCPEGPPTSACARCVGPLLGQRAPLKLEGRLARRWEELRAEVRAAAAVVCPSEELRASLARELRLDGSRWHVVPHGLCRELARPVRVEDPAGPLRVLAFGNRCEVKGQLELVQAAASLPAGTLRLVLAGEEVEAGFDERLRAAAGGLELELHGRYDATALEALAARADVAAFPSRAAESYGLVVEEALGLGLPTLVSDRGSLPEVLRTHAHDDGLPGAILPAESPRSWAEGLRRLVERPELVQDARARLPARLRSAGDAARELESIYAGLVRPQTVRGA